MTKLVYTEVEKMIKKFALNFSLVIQEGYVINLFDDLSYRNITNEDFFECWKKVYYNATTTFNKMPNVAMFLEHSASKTLTDEQKNVQRASEVIKWLEDNINYNDYADKPYKWQWSGNRYKSFNDPVINDMIVNNFVSCSALIERFKEQKNAGYTELFRKELVEFMKISEVTVDDTLIIESDEKGVKMLDSCIGKISNNFNKEKIIGENWLTFRMDKMVEGMREDGRYECAGVMIPTNPIRNAWNKLTEQEKLNLNQNRRK